jgi:hypothetical protein
VMARSGTLCAVPDTVAIARPPVRRRGGEREAAVRRLLPVGGLRGDQIRFGHCKTKDGKC